MQVNFYKYHGTGNDFIILDNRKNEYDFIDHKQVKLLCHRKFGIGADGLMLLNLKAGYDFEMKYFNADGGLGSMCGNGARCLVKFAYDMGIHRSNYKFLSSDGPHEAEIELTGIIRLKMGDVNEIEFRNGFAVLNTGSPHYVKFIGDIMEFDVKTEGSEIRHNREFEEDGINVNFVESLDEDEIYVRTYERGVEDETMSCGTGVTASAIIAAHNDIGFNRVEIRTRGGKLSVEFDKIDDQRFENIWLCGPAIKVYKGEMDINEQVMKPIEQKNNYHPGEK